MEKNVLISIITVCYNSEKTIKDTIESVLNQTYTNIEYILVDGASKDNTVDIIKSYEEKAKEKGIIYRWVSEPDKGIYDAMNKGIDMASGEWIYFIGSDDVLYCDITLEKIKNFLKEEDSVYYGNVVFKERNNIYSGKFNKYKLAIKNISHQAIFFPQAIIKKEKYDMNYKLLSDYYLNIKLYGCGTKFEYIEEIIAIYNDLGTSGLNKDNDFEKIRDRIIMKELGIDAWLFYKILRTIYIVKRKINGKGA